ncbi:heparin lyase I family protein [Aquimarina sp. 2201CG1-2-11]|uniref:heparin lyase I family protein n=1 Tax=Aquimarina discodermiae TaxID=3231043 RepID=UPI0034618657
MSVYKLNSILLLTVFFILNSCGNDDKEDITNEPQAVYTPLISYNMKDGVLGDGFLNWFESEYDATHFVSEGKSIKISTRPSTSLPICSGDHFFAGRTTLDTKLQIPQGKTLWYRVMHYIPSTFSFGYKYGGVLGDEVDAEACNQFADGNTWLKWMVVSPTSGGRVYLQPSENRRNITHAVNQIRLITGTDNDFLDIEAVFPKDQWFALQIAVKVSNGSDGFVRAWIDDTFLGEKKGPTFPEEASIMDWGIGDYWNGVPWTDGEAGRTAFWIDEIILATDIEGYGAPTTLDKGGRPYINASARVKDFNSK